MPPLTVGHKDAIDRHFRYIQARRHGVLTMRVRVFFRQQADRVVNRYLGVKTEVLPIWTGRLAFLPEFKETRADEILPDEEARRLQIVMYPDLQDQYIQSAILAGGLVGEEDPPDPGDQRLQDYLLQAGERITGINATTRDDVAQAIALGGERGYTPYQIAHGGRGTDADFVTVHDVVSNADPEGHYRGRADTIVRTELAYASARATTDSYRDAGDGVVEQVEVRDGDSAQWGPCGWRFHDDEDIADGSIRSLDEAEQYPIAHPNAVFAGSSFVAYGDLREIRRARYSGPAVRIETGHAGPRMVGTTIGPNHPMLTQRGMVAARDLKPGDNLIYDLRHEAAWFDLDLKHVPPRVEQVFETFDVACGHTAVARTADDFHNDGSFCYGEVDVVFPNRQLLNVWNLGGVQQASQSLLVATYVQPPILTRGGPGLSAAERVRIAATSGVSRFGVGDVGSGHFVLAPITSIETVHFEGWAFDATTVEAIYSSDGFVVSNCVRVFLPLFAGMSLDV
jgi:hypothetical protein